MSLTPVSPVKKGKLKQFNSNFDDLEPVITYRHLHSPFIGPKHPLRIVALCDCNAFYANCEQVRLGIDPETPLVVLQWGMLIAVNYPARNFGISRMDKLDDALKRCPGLVVVHVATYAEGEEEPKYWEKPDIKTHKISLDLYRRESIKIHNMLKELLPTGEVEKASIDEAFIDFSIPVRDAMLERYQYLAAPPVDAPDGLDTPLPRPPRISYAGLGNLIPIDPSKLHSDQEVTTELVEEIERDGPVTWHDLGLSIAAEQMASMRNAVHEKLGYLTSAGLARNKFLAKLAASYRKFNTQNILRNTAIPGFLKPMPFQKIRFLGGKLGKAMANEYDVSTVGDLLHINIDEMQSKFGECSVWVYEILRGIDRSEVKEKSAINKSMNASKTLPKPITKPSEGPHWIRMLAAELAIRLNEARENTPGLWPRTLCLHLRQGWSILRSKQKPFPPPRANVTVDFMSNEAGKLWKELVGSDMLWDGKKEMKVTGLSLGLTGIIWAEERQKSIQGFLREKTTMAAGEAASEDIGGPVPGRRMARERSNGVNPGSDEEVLMLDDADDNEDSRYSFKCSRCRQAISLPSHLRRMYEKNDNNDSDSTPNLDHSQQVLLTNLRMEHDDYHFAQDLAHQDENVIGIASSSGRPRSIPPSSRPTKRRKTDKQTNGNIADFFNKKPKI